MAEFSRTSTSRLGVWEYALAPPVSATCCIFKQFRAVEATIERGSNGKAQLGTDRAFQNPTLCTDFEGSFDVMGIGVGGDENDWDVRPDLTNFLGQHESAKSRQGDIHEKHVRFHGREDVQGNASVIDGGNHVEFRFEYGSDLLLEEDKIFGDENPWATARLPQPWYHLSCPLVVVAGYES